ncbi:MAG: maleylpyruvate isomerase family mycothiol-dependent enzyme, partial [Ardenticatenaceae bacterium]
MLQQPEPVIVLDLFSEDRDALLALLDGLTPEEWERPTVCAGWSVRDVALHLLGGDLGNLSRRRDGFVAQEPMAGESLLEFINRLNDEWMRAARRLSPRLTCD